MAQARLDICNTMNRRGSFPSIMKIFERFFALGRLPVIFCVLSMHTLPFSNSWGNDLKFRESRSARVRIRQSRVRFGKPLRTTTQICFYCLATTYMRMLKTGVLYHPILSESLMPTHSSTPIRIFLEFATKSQSWLLGTITIMARMTQGRMEGKEYIG